jgi:hypothetical protein
LPRAEGRTTPEFAQVDPKTKLPVDNGARNVWVTETVLATALNVSYMASAQSLFSLVVGIALPLAGVGFIVLALGALPRGSTAAAGEWYFLASKEASCVGPGEPK